MNWSRKLEKTIITPLYIIKNVLKKPRIWFFKAYYTDISQQWYLLTHSGMTNTALVTNGTQPSNYNIYTEL